MKKLPIGLQSFARIREEGYLYVDKTKRIFQLIDEGSLYFLSRPRRFGKTLLISTLKELFKGNKSLFDGLYIANQTDYNWTSYPILQFNFAKLGHKVSNLEDRLKEEIQEKAKEFNITFSKTELSQQLGELIKGIATADKPVVLLVDEYDKPIIDHLIDSDRGNHNREVIRGFFAPLKDLEEKGYIRFLFVTGVSKFSQVSIFSDLNNLTDLTLDPFANDLVGITHEELDLYFKQHIQRSAAILNMTTESLIEGIQTWYDGYSFNGETFLYNPFSLLNFFRKSRFGNFWFETGTPTFLVHTIRDRQVKPTEIAEKHVKEIFFSKFSLDHLDIHALLFQTGYLTIKEVYRKGLELYYVLGYPNEEVRHAFIHHLLEAYTYQASTIVGNAMIRIEQALENGDIETFIAQVKVLLSDISFHLLPQETADTQQQFEVWEGYFHTIIYLITSFLRLSVQSEVSKHKGRLDLIVETDEYLYLMEFKLNQSANQAIQQIKTKEYATSYQNLQKKILLVGISFSKKTRNIASWEVEEWEKS